MSKLGKLALRLALPVAGLAMASAASAEAYVTTSDGAAAATMPCDDPMDNSQGVEGLEMTVCLIDDVVYMFVSASGAELADFDPFSSTFDAAWDAVGGSHDTSDLEEGMENGMRTITAVRSRDAGLGMMRAFELAEDRMIYVIAVSDVADGPASDTQKALGQRFISSLRVML